ncbi:hypothetical protein WAI453_000358 [Rhynchosporium graminicola]
MSAADVGSVILASVETKPSVKDFGSSLDSAFVASNMLLSSGLAFIWEAGAGKPPENKFLAEERDITGCVSKKIPVQEHKLFWGCVSKQQMLLRNEQQCLVTLV